MLWEHCSIPLLLELGFHGGLLNYWGREGKKESAAYWVTLSLGHGHIPLSPLEPIFSFTANTSGTNISIHNFCHFLLLYTKAYETSQQTTHLFYSIYSFVLILSKNLKNFKELTYSTQSPCQIWHAEKSQVCIQNSRSIREVGVCSPRRQFDPIQQSLPSFSS